MKNRIHRLPSWVTWMIVSVLCISVSFASQGMNAQTRTGGNFLAYFGAQTVSAADYSVSTQAELLSAIATAPDGSVITVMNDIKITRSSVWTDKTLTIKGANESVTLTRISGSENAPLFNPGGTSAAVTATAGLILKEIIIDDNGNPDGFGYDGIVCAYRPNVTITLDSGAMLRNNGGKSGVYLGNITSTVVGPRLHMLEGSSILYGESAGASPGAGVYAGTGAVFEMDGGIIQSNRTAGSGGGVYVDDSATLIMRGAALVKGNSAEAGGGVLVSANGDGGAFIMEGGTVTGNVLLNALTTKNNHGLDVAVEAPRGSAIMKAGTAPNYTDAAYVAQLYPGAVIGNGRIGIQNKVSLSYAASGTAFNQAIYVPTPINETYFAGSLRQYGSAGNTAVLDALNAAATSAMTPSYPTFGGLTYAGEVQVSADSRGEDSSISLNFPDDLPAYDNAGNHIRDHYGYAVAYVPLAANSTILAGETPKVATLARGAERITFNIPAVAGAASYGIVKYYYDKSGAMELSIERAGNGSFKEKNSGRTSLRFDSIPSGGGFAPSPASYTLKATADAGWKLGAVILTAGDGSVIRKEADTAGEVTVDYYDLAYGANKIIATFVKDNGEISLNVSDSSAVYDGKPHRVTVSGTLPTDEVAYAYRVGDSAFIRTSMNPSFTNVNSVIAKGMKGVTGNEIIVYVTATRGGICMRDSAFVKISPRGIKVKPVDRNRKYNGEPLTAKAVELVSGSLVSGHRLDVSKASYSGSRIDIGTSESRVSSVSISGTDAANYMLSYGTGKLRVTKPDPVPEQKNDNSSGTGGNRGNGSDPSDGGTNTGDTGTGNGGDTNVPPSDNQPPDNNEEEIDQTPEGGNIKISPEPLPTTDSEMENPSKDTPIKHLIKSNIFSTWWVWLILFALIAAAVVLYIWFALRRRRRERDEYWQ